MVPKWYQTGASVGSQLLEVLQVVGILSGKLKLHLIAGHRLYVELCKAPIEQLAVGEIHYLEGSYIILQLPSGQDSTASPQWAAVTHI